MKIRLSIIILISTLFAVITYLVCRNDFASVIVFLGIFAISLFLNKITSVNVAGATIGLITLIGTIIPVISTELDIKEIIRITEKEIIASYASIKSGFILSKNPLLYDKGVVINGVRWATRNVDKPGTFAKNPEDPGMFYQWNSNVGWSATDPPVSTDSSSWKNNWNGNNSIVWQTANNVCPSGWRLPTREEFQSLIDAGSVWSNNPKGRFFGSDSNTLFLPLFGVLSNGDGFLLKDEMTVSGKYYELPTYYWGNNNVLYIERDKNSGPCCAAVLIQKTSYHGYGFLVRCIAE